MGEKALTETQLALLTVVFRRPGVSFRELARGLSLSMRGVYYHLDRLRQRGYLAWTPKASRTIVLRGVPILAASADGDPVLLDFTRPWNDDSGRAPIPQD